MILFKIDAEKDEGLELAKKYHVKGYPTFALMNAEGAVINTWSGYGDVPGFVATLEGAMADMTTIDERRARYAASPTAADAQVLASFHSARNDYAEAVELLQKACELEPAEAHEHLTALFTNTAYGFLRGGSEDKPAPYTKDDVVAAADRVIAEPRVEAAEVVQVAEFMQYLAARAKDIPMMFPYVKAALARTADTTDPDLEKARGGLLVAQALHIDEDKPRAVELKRATMPESWQEDAGGINSFAWWCFENDVNLEEAETLARKGVDLAEAGKDKAMILDTLAEICHALGDTDEALAQIRLAVEQDPENEFYQKQLTRFTELAAPTS